jgi:hypothetical protein
MKKQGYLKKQKKWVKYTILELIRGLDYNINYIYYL